MKKKLHIGILDYIKAIKIADRDMNLDNGFKSKHKIHKSKKAYKRNNKVNLNSI
jgi:hypothetical protein